MRIEEKCQIMAERLAGSLEGLPDVYKNAIQRAMIPVYQDWIETSSNMLLEAADEIKKLQKNMYFLQQYARDTWDYWEQDEVLKVGKRLKAMAGSLPGYSHEIDEIQLGNGVDSEKEIEELRRELAKTGKALADLAIATGMMKPPTECCVREDWPDLAVASIREVLDGNEKFRIEGSEPGAAVARSEKEIEELRCKLVKAEKTLAEEALVDLAIATGMTKLIPLKLEETIDFIQKNISYPVSITLQLGRLHLSFINSDAMKEMSDICSNIQTELANIGWKIECPYIECNCVSGYLLRLE